jgi:hypothetical protein
MQFDGYLVLKKSIFIILFVYVYVDSLSYWCGPMLYDSNLTCIYANFIILVHYIYIYIYKWPIAHQSF